MKKMDVRSVQRLQMEALHEVDRICRRHQLRYYLIGGTLIGAVRHKGFVPWDDDIDIAMLRPDYEAFLAVCREELEDRFFLQNATTDPYFYQSLTRICTEGTYINEGYSKHLPFHKGLYLDIFPLDPIPDSEKERKKHAREIRRWDKLIFYKSCYVYDRGFLRTKWLGKKILQMLLAPVSFSWIMDRKERAIRRFEHEDRQWICSTASRYPYEKQIHPVSRFGNPEYLEFEGERVPAPTDWHGYLQQVYGNYMKLPPEEQQKPEHDAYWI